MHHKSIYISVAASFLFVYAAAQQSIIRVDSFYSSAVQNQTKYTAILPGNYDIDKNKSFPVVYLLHGYEGNYTTWITWSKLPVQLATEYQCIIILPDGGNSWFVNWNGQTDGKPHKWEDMIIKELIPFIDKHYRTISNKNNRIIGGLSMGGFGSISIGLRNPGKFGFIFSISGDLNFCNTIKEELAEDSVLYDSPQLLGYDTSVIADIKGFATQTERTPKGKIFATVAQADAYNPFEIIKNADATTLPFIHIDCGLSDDFINDAREFKEAVSRKTKGYSYLEMPGGHHSPYWGKAVRHVFLEIKQELLKDN